MTKPFPGDGWSRPGGDWPVVPLVTAPVQRPRAAPAEPAHASASRTVRFHFGGLSSSSGSLAMVAAIVLASSLVMRWRVCPISDAK
jgi:hypothetical protein